MSGPGVDGDVKGVPAFAPIGQTAGSPTAIAVDRQGFNSGVFEIGVGAATGTPTSWTLDAKVQESDASASGYADTNPLISIAQRTNVQGAGLVELAVDFRPLKRYLKLVATVAFVGGTSPTLPVSAECVMGDAVNKPA